MDYYQQVTEGDAFDDFLVSLASGLASAQQQLSDLSSSNALGTNVSYQIPRLDFELSLQIKTETSASTTPNNSVLQPISRQNKITRVIPVNDTKGNVSANSKISGSFIAVPINGGRPQAIIDLSFIETSTPNLVDTVVKIIDTNGEAMVGVEVEIDVDKELSNTINQREGLNIDLKDDTHIRSGVVMTDPQGIAAAKLQIANDETMGANIVVSVTAASSTQSLIYRAGS